jgi:DegV family protein with EDD domain
VSQLPRAVATGAAPDTLDGLRLGRALTAGILRLLSRQEHLNKINVFPVPDGDTGTNLAMTMGAVLKVLQRSPDEHAGRTLTHVADAALDGARGNSGAILAQFFAGVGDHAGHLVALGPADFAAAMRAGAESARDSLSEPREGTILTVLTDFASAMRVSGREAAPDIRALLARGVAAAEASLARTPELLDALRKANVVDAGAQGFVELVVGIQDYLEHGRDHEPMLDSLTVLDAHDEETAGHEEELEYRFCTECVIVGERVDRRRLRERLAQVGGSLVIAGLQTKVRVHAHVNEPAEVFRIAGEFGTVSGEKADDMQRQQHAAHATRRKVAIVTDSGADIPEDDMDRLDIHMVPARVHFGERSYLDKIGITPAEFYRELATNPRHPKTSQPPPGDFRRRFEFLASHYETVLSINLSRRVSGTFAAAETAASRTTSHGQVHVVDSMNASLGQGLVVMFAAERAQAGDSIEQVLAATHSVIPLTETFAMVGSLEYAVRGGRVPRWVKSVADALRLMPVLHNTASGRVKSGGVLLGRRNLKEKFARFVAARMSARRSYRILVGHGHAEADGRWLLERLNGPNVAEAKLLPLGSALGVHGGPGMLCVGVQQIAPTSERAFVEEPA